MNFLRSLLLTAFVVVIASLSDFGGVVYAQENASSADELDWHKIKSQQMPAWPPASKKTQVSHYDDQELDWKTIKSTSLAALPWPPQSPSSASAKSLARPLGPGLSSSHDVQQELDWSQLDSAFDPSFIADHLPGVGASAENSDGDDDQSQEDLTIFDRLLNLQQRIRGASITYLALHLDNENGDDNDDNYLRMQERLFFMVSAGDFSTRARLALDAFAFPGQSDFLDGKERGVAQNAQLERLQIAWRGRGFTVQAGDLYQLLGRGLSLNLRKPASGVAVDVALRGARVAYASTNHKIEAFAGWTNSENIDSVNYRHVDDPNDFLAGSQYEFRLGSLFRVASYGLFSLPNERLLDEFTDLSFTGGMWAQTPSLFLDGLGLFAEAAFQERFLANTWQTGWALSATLDYRFGDVTLLGEALYISNFNQSGSRNTALGQRFDYNQPPTLERLDQEILSNEDVLGTHTKIEWYSSSLALLLYGNLMIKANKRLFETEQVDQIHGYVGFEWSPFAGRERLFGSVGLRDEAHGGWILPAKRLRTMAHLDVDWLHPLGDGFMLHATTNTQMWFAREKTWLQGSTFLAFERSGQYGITYELGVDGNNQSLGVENIFHAFIVTVDVIAQTKLRATIGSQRGGIKCVAGVCREFPPFAGGQLEITTQF